MATKGQVYNTWLGFIENWHNMQEKRVTCINLSIWTTEIKMMSNNKNFFQF